MKANHIYLHRLKNNDFVDRFSHIPRFCRCKYFTDNILNLKIKVEDCDYCKTKNQTK